MINNNLNSIGSIELPLSKELIRPKFSFYKRPIRNSIPQKAVTLWEIYELIRSDCYKWQTDKLRTLTDIDKAKSFKRENFDYVTASGIFTYREVKSLSQHSGLLAIDLDELPNVKEIKNAMIEDKWLEPDLAFISPSGRGVKLIVSIDLQFANHLDWFMSISNFIKTTYKLDVDPTGKDISRAVFLGQDSEAFINPKHIQ